VKRVVKWVSIIGGCLLVIILLALLVIPKLVDVQQYKPQIEKQVAEATSRSFSVGDDLRLSLFPWAGLSFSDLSLGSLPGFEQDKFVTVESFKMQVKLVPLLFKDIQIKRFLLKGARIVLEKSKDGRVNWEFAKKVTDKPVPEIAAQKETTPADTADKGLLLKSLVVGDFAITKGSVLWIDHTRGQRKTISDVNLKLKDVSLESPFQLVFSARLDGKPLDLQGSMGPIGKDLGKGDVPVDLTLKAIEQLEIRLKGRIINPAGRPRFDLDVRVSPFSPRKLMAALKQPFPIKTADPKALNSLAFKAGVKGDPQRITVSDGALDIDESKVRFFVKARDFSKPDIEFDIKLDRLDADRYLPPSGEKKTLGGNKQARAANSASKAKAGEPGPKTKAGESRPKPVDYTPLRRLVLNGTAKIEKLKVKNAKVENVNLKITAKNGIFNLAPISMKLYQGAVSGRAALNVQKDTPKTEFDLDAGEIQAGPLLNDVLKKDIIEGTLKAQARITLSGDTPETIKKTISGDGDLLFRNGAVKGIDLAGMVRNVQAAFGLAEKSTQKPKTDFAELHVPFTIKRGLVNTSKTILLSPLVRVAAAGKADLVTESLDFRVEPKFVGTLKGQGDTMDRSGIMVPVLVSGTFAAPKFKPDLEGMFKDKLDKKLQELQKGLLGGDQQKDKPSSLEDQIKGFFKGLPFGK